MKKRLPIIIFILLLVLAIAGGVFFYLSGKTKFNDGYVNGNTAGNLYNGGRYCEYDGTLYFANPSDRDALYSMDLDGGNLTKLCDDVVSFINVDEHYIYYIRNNPGTHGDAFSFLSVNTNSLCRIDRDGSEDSIKTLDSNPCLYASLIGDYIYYVHYTAEDGSSLYKVKIDGSNCQQVNKNPYFTCSANGQYMYYNGIDGDHYIWRLNTADDSNGMLYGGNCWMPIVADESTAYFMDCDNNYAIACVDLTTGEKTLLSEDRVDWYNVYGDYIYFQRNDAEHPALCRMRTDGTDYKELVDGNYMNISVTSTHVYFQDFISEQTFCMSKASGSKPEPFDPGIAQ